MLNFSIILVVLLFLCDCLAEELIAEARDSYIDAYQEFHGGSQNIVQNKNERGSHYNDNDPGQFYGPPIGYPEPSYPPQSYGPPVYGPPEHIPSYPTPLDEMPYALRGLLDKIKLKLDIYTILKIILKLVIFKKIVKFLALICLLLFIPKFKISKEGNDSDEAESRAFINGKTDADQRLNNLTQYVLSAIEKYSNNSTSTEINSEAERMFQDIDDKLPYQRLFFNYFSEDS